MHSNEVVSYHVFLFPFICDSGKIFTGKTIEKTGLWGKTENPDKSEELSYNQEKYFYKHVCSAICSDSNEIVSNWSYKLGQINQYIIKKDDDTEYILKIENIKLHLYNTNVGVLLFYLVNTEYKNENDILAINDFGRRIYPPYFREDNFPTSSLPQSITLSFDKKKIKESFPRQKYLNESKKISCTILDLLGKDFTTNENEKRKKRFIEPIIDDRMFTLCWWGNDKRSQTLVNNYTMNMDFWYKFVFIDSSDATCQNDEMIESLLKKHTYNRWSKYGTLFGITRYSLLLLTSANAPSFLRDHLRTLYTQMVCLSLVQRASILKFSQEISDLCTKNISSIQKIHSDYMKFVNQIYFREVTAQEQGIEMYGMITDSMEIERDIKRLDEEIDELYQYSRLEEEQKINQSLHLLTLIGSIFLPPTLMITFLNLSNTQYVTSFYFYLLVIIPILFSIIAISIYLIKKCCKKNTFNWWPLIIILAYMSIFVFVF